MNVLNIISTTLTAQHSTYFNKNEVAKKSPRSMLKSSSKDSKSTHRALTARQFNTMNTSIIIQEVSSEFCN
jgi:hypothetical protein